MLDYLRAQKYTDGQLLYVADVETGLPLSTTHDVYDQYDTLVSTYPNYAAKTDLGTDSVGNHIYLYTFKTPDYNSDATVQRPKDAIITKPKILITTGVHGDEKGPVLSLYRFARDLCQKKNGLQVVREGIELQIIPVGVPSAYNSNARVNSNLVNINRNFNVDWVAGGEGTGDYAGASAASETETQIIQTWLGANADCAYFIDMHNSGYTDEITYLAASVDTAYGNNIKNTYLKTIDKVSKRWTEKYNVTTSKLGYTGNYDTIATAQKYGDLIKIKSMTLEISWQIDSVKYSPITNAIASETIGNLLIALSSYYISSNITPTLLNGWTAGSSLPGYQNVNGRVYLQGRVTGGSVPSVAFVLPIGYRPYQSEVFAVSSSWAFGAVMIDPNGTVTVQKGSGSLVNLSGISFAI